jgi:hypothetical protein
LPAAAWIGRQLRALGAVDASSETQRVLRLGRIKLRVVPLAAAFVEDVLTSTPGVAHEAVADSLAFCHQHAACDSCAFRAVGCAVRRIQEERSAKR